MSTHYPRLIWQMYSLDKALNTIDLWRRNFARQNLRPDGNRLVPLTETREYQGDAYYKTAPNDFWEMSRRVKPGKVERLRNKLSDILEEVGEELLERMRVQYWDSLDQTMRDEGLLTCDGCCAIDQFDYEIRYAAKFQTVEEALHRVNDMVDNTNMNELTEFAREYFEGMFDEEIEECEDNIAEYQAELWPYRMFLPAILPDNKIWQTIDYYEREIQEQQERLNDLKSDEYILNLDAECILDHLIFSYEDTYADEKIEESKNRRADIIEHDSVLNLIQQAIDMLEEEYTLESVNFAINVEHNQGDMCDTLKMEWRILNMSLTSFFQLLSEGDFIGARNLLSAEDKNIEDRRLRMTGVA